MKRLWKRGSGSRRCRLRLFFVFYSFVCFFNLLLVQKVEPKGHPLNRRGRLNGGPIRPYVLARIKIVSAVFESIWFAFLKSKSPKTGSDGPPSSRLGFCTAGNYKLPARLENFTLLMSVLNIHLLVLLSSQSCTSCQKQLCGLCVFAVSMILNRYI
jgi:hypothetical protein